MNISRHGGRSNSWGGGGHVAVMIKGHLLKIVLLMTGPKIGGAEGISGSTGRLNISLVIQA